MKKMVFMIIVVCMLAACTSTPNPNVGPELQVVIPPLFSPSPDIPDDTIGISITVKHPVGIRNWDITIQPIRTRPQSEQPPQGQRQRRIFFEHKGNGTPPAVWKWDGKSTSRASEMVQSATDYQFVLSVNDIFNNNSVYEGVIAVDVIVRRDGDKLRMVVPAITFQGDSSNFTRVAGDLTEDAINRNTRVLRMISNALSKYPGYNITIEGHANPLAAQGTPERIRQEAIYKPLSEQRARAVGEYLATNHNIARTRFSYAGMGTSRTVVGFNEPEDEKWKNRRVEFILER